MPYRGSKASHKKNNFIGENAKNKKSISLLEEKLVTQQKSIKSLEDKVRNRKKRQKFLTEKLSAIENDDNIPAIAVSAATRKRRLSNPTSEVLMGKAKERRTKETIQVCSAIHGGSENNQIPALNGMVLTVTSKFKASEVAQSILSSKKSVVDQLSRKITSDNHKKYYNSTENTLRSINVYYSQDVLGKRKYLTMRKANKVKNLPNFVPYKKLAVSISSIDIGDIYDICPKFTHDVPEEDMGTGKYKNFVVYAQRLAKMYLKLNQYREKNCLNS